MGGLWVLQRRAMASPEAQPSSRPSPGTSQPTAVDGGSRAAGLQPGAVSSNQACSCLSSGLPHDACAFSCTECVLRDTLSFWLSLARRCPQSRLLLWNEVLCLGQMQLVALCAMMPPMYASLEPRTEPAGKHLLLPHDICGCSAVPSIHGFQLHKLGTAHPGQLEDFESKHCKDFAQRSNAACSGVGESIFRSCIEICNQYILSDRTCELA